jgi:dipeptidase D
MSSPLESLEPKLLWSHFDAIRSIPRPSKHEGQIAAHVDAWAAGRGFEVRTDDAGNRTIRVPATGGHEDAPTVVLQGHLDMVCEKNSDVNHDFMSQGIEVVVDGDWVSAKGTTLGADNGIGVAAAMAVAEDPSCVHGPLEILCTMDEETGLTGAKLLDPSNIEGRTMINLDTEEDAAIYIGCAGGADVTSSLPLARRRGLLASIPIRIAVRGLRGGHSGLNIIENRGNAIKLTTRILLAALDAAIEVDVVALEGGSKHNAIPREAFATCRVHRGDLDRLRTAADACHQDFKEEFLSSDPEFEVAVETLDDTEDLQHVLNVHARDRLLRLLDAIPHGVLAMSREVIGLVESSNNMAVVSTEGDHARIITSHRSSIMPALNAIGRQITSISTLSGATVSSDDPYPGWKPNPESPIVKKTARVFEQVLGSRPEIKAIHAGLECGLLIEKMPDMDAVSIGPEIQNAHSPEERVQISSVDRFYTVLKALLEDLS